MNNFAVTDSADAVLAIFLATIGNIASLIGLGIATAGIGAESILGVTAAVASKMSSRGGIIPIKPGPQQDVTPNAGSNNGGSSGGGQASLP